MTLPVSLAIAAADALLNLWLALRVSQRRIARKVLIGDGGDSVMIARGRAHANLVEYAPFVLVLIALIEMARGPALWLWGLGAAFVIARIAHPLGMDRPAPNPLRAVGALMTWGVLAALAGWALAIAWQADTGAAPGDPMEIVPASA